MQFTPPKMLPMSRNVNRFFDGTQAYGLVEKRCQACRQRASPREPGEVGCLPAGPCAKSGRSRSEIISHQALSASPWLRIFAGLTALWISHTLYYRNLACRHSECLAATLDNESTIRIDVNSLRHYGLASPLKPHTLAQK